MRLLVLSSLLCILLLCFSAFSVEGKRHARHSAKPWKGKPWKGKPCCFQVPSPARRTRRGRPVKTCRPCKFKPETSFWVVPGALPQV